MWYGDKEMEELEKRLEVFELLVSVMSVEVEEVIEMMDDWIVVSGEVEDEEDDGGWYGSKEWSEYCELIGEE